MFENEEVQRRLESLLNLLDARAAGWWRLEDAGLASQANPAGKCLRLLSFVGAADLPPSVNAEFVETTARVGLEHLELGIVRAVLERVPAVSIAEVLPGHLGSGRWLRAFGAHRSVAVPLQNDAGEVQGVLSVALPTLGPPGDVEVADLVRKHATAT